MIEQMIDPVRRHMAGNEKSPLVRAALAALLLICLMGYLFTGAPLANAQAEENISIEDRFDLIDDRFDQIDFFLEEIAGNLTNMHGTYLTKQFFETEIEKLSDTMDDLEKDLSALQTLEERTWYLAGGTLLVVLSPYASDIVSRRRNKKTEKNPPG